MGKKNIHVVYRKDTDKWAVEEEGSSRAIKLFDTKQEAMRHGRELAKKRGVELIPHKKTGEITNPNSYGNDPYPPRDRKH